MQPDTSSDRWIYFFSHGNLPETMRPAQPIYQSWVRCQKLMQPMPWKMPHRAAGATLRSICQRKNDLLVLGQAALEDAYEYMESRPCVLQILDESGCLLWQCGHVKTRTALAALGFDIGSYWAEGHIGTNAPALAMRDGNPVQVHGDEHFKQALRAWHCSATPVYDNSGRQRAVIVIASLAADYAVSDLPLTLAIAREIGNSLHTDALLSETNRHLNELYALLDGVEDGVLAWDHNGCLQYLNHRAAGMLLLDEQNSLGRPLPSLLTLPSLLQHAIQQRLPLNHVEMTFESRKQFIATLLTLKPVPDGEHCGFIALLHPLDQLRRLVNHQLGKVSQTFEQMPAGSLDMRRLLRYGRQAARGQHPILLQGEEGVGKELLAQAIHNASERANSSYIAINCQTLVEGQFAKELLGSDATETDAGLPSKFELANGGTLYLEQIEYLPPEMQSVLLQIIKTGVIMRQNSSRIIPVDVRIIAATGANLPLLVKQGRFRRQLFYTLQSFELQIPPLRQRQSDIPLLVTHHLNILGQHFHCRYQIDEAVLLQLRDYPWPGNDQELKGVVERAAMICQHNHIRMADLPEHLMTEKLTVEPESPLLTPVMSLEDAERQAIIRAAHAAQGKPHDMARMLGIGRTTLWRKLKQYQLEMEQFKSD